jgi:hypothetical protein
MDSYQNNNTSFSCRIVIKLRDRSDLPYQAAGEINAFFEQDAVIPWRQLRSQFPGIRIDKLFSSLDAPQITALVKKAEQADKEYMPVNFLSYYFIECKEDHESYALLNSLRDCENVELAYIENRPVEPPSFITTSNALHQSQGYLNASPEGIDARFAWQIAGGDGHGGIKFIDIEQGWLLDHKALSAKTLPCTGLNHYLFEDHGAAVLGIIQMSDKEKGGTGITPKAEGYVISQWRPDGSFNNADAIMAAIGHLDFGDVLLLESQSYDSPSSCNAWPVEIEEATFRVIRLATALGIIVVEAAGNGSFETGEGNDLDLLQINGDTILNPASAGFRDSGAIVVAAASSDMPHTRIGYSNYGKRVNCYAWGEHVVTAGFYPGSSGFAINTYTGKFCGTSSASAIIAGAAIAIQSIADTHLSSRLTPKQMRTFLSSPALGTVSANGHSADKIGVMPDLQKIITHTLQVRPPHLNSHTIG